MSTLLLTHDACIDHATPDGHPERPDRMRAVHKVLGDDLFAGLEREDAPLGDVADVARVHPQSYIDDIQAKVPTGNAAVPLDPDTWLSAGSWEAVMRCVGAGTRAVDQVVTGAVDNAFCAVRPPGHHAETAVAMGFCLFNSAAVAAHYARAKHGLERIAVIDFDVHHGNGTQEIFWSDRNLVYGSTHQMPLFPGTGAHSETGEEANIFNAPLRPGDAGVRFREAFDSVILPALDNMRPDLIVISAGFDAHIDDPLGGLNLVENDYAWVTAKLMESADRHCEGRIVSMLEGGYDLRALAASTAIHVRTLMQS